MIIRDEQIATMERALVLSFRRRAAVTLRLQFPEFTSAMTDEQLDLRIGAATAKASLYKLVTEEHVLRYLEFDIQYGADFMDRFALAGEILSRDDLTATDKLDALDQWEMFSRPPQVDRAAIENPGSR